jgi:hypothetical protein
MWKIGALRRIQHLKDNIYIRKKLHKKTARRIMEATTVDNAVALTMLAFDEDRVLADNLELLFSDDKEADEPLGEHD